MSPITALVLFLIGLFFVEFILLLIRLKLSGLRALFKKEDSGGFSQTGNYNYKILVLGDSTATGKGAKPSESIAGRVAQEYNASVTNLGKNGAKIKDVIKQITSVRDHHFDMILIMAGNNDIVQFTPCKILSKELDVLFEIAKKMSRNVIMFRGGNLGNFPFFPISIAWIVSRRSKTVREICMKRALATGSRYVELFMSRHEDIFLKDPTFYYTPDLIHLNGKGYEVWFQHLMKELAITKNINLR